MRVLLVGDGAREHALALLMARSASGPRIAALMKNHNPGIERVVLETGGRVYHGSPTSPEDAVRAAEDYGAELVVIGPEEPLFAGVADALRERGFPVFGAGRASAMIEMDKVYARELMWRHRIPGRLRFRGFSSPEEAAEYARAAGDVVVKPARQAGGRGVRVFAQPMEHIETGEAAAGYAARLAEEMKKRYQGLRYTVIVEERVDGVEYTVPVVSDGETTVALPAAQDNPHLFPYDIGPETGGMGAIAGPAPLLPFLEQAEYNETLEILGKTLEALRGETGEPYRGALSGQMMLTGLWGPVVIEYYARLGDPETGTLLPLVESDFLELLDRAARGRLAGYKLRVREDVYVVVKALAPAGYPLNRGRARGHPVAFNLDAARERGCELLVGGVTRSGGGGLVTTGSRVAEVVCWSSLGHEDASRRAEEVIASGAVRLLDGHPLVHRWDVGSGEQLTRRMRMAELARMSYRRRREKGLTRIYDWVPGKGLIVHDYS